MKKIGLFGAFSGPIGTNSSAPHSHGNFKGVFAEKGARFCGKRGLGPLPPPQAPRPRPPFLLGGGFTENPRGGGVLQGGGGGGEGGPGACTGNFLGGGGGGAEAPFTAKTSPFFGENTFERAEIGPERAPFWPNWRLLGQAPVWISLTSSMHYFARLGGLQPFRARI